MSASDSHKALGNAAFSAGRYKEAVRHFSDAIAVDASNHVLYSNRSAAQARGRRRRRGRSGGERERRFRAAFRGSSALAATAPSSDTCARALTCRPCASRRH